MYNNNELNKKTTPITDKGYGTDGAINLEQWNQQDIKILFLLKEPHGDHKGECYPLDVKLNDENESRDIITASIAWRRMAMISKVLVDKLNGKPQDLSDNTSMTPDQIQNAIQKIAFVNIKEDMGESRAINSEIKEALRVNAQWIEEKIDDLNPDIIILGGTAQYFENFYDNKNNFFETSKSGEDHKDNWVYKSERFNSYLIDFWHPSIIYTKRKFQDEALNCEGTNEKIYNILLSFASDIHMSKL